MKIVIDIDEHIYEQVMADSEVYVLDNEVDRILIENAIYEGTPLPKHLNKIKAEIEQKQYDFMANKDYDEGVRFGLLLAYQIIDKYIEGSGNE